MQQQRDKINKERENMKNSTECELITNSIYLTANPTQRNIMLKEKG